MTGQGTTTREEWAGHWPLVFSAMIGMSFYTVITYALGTFIEPLEKAFGWSRAEISLGVTIFALISTVGGPFIGAAIDRWGTRRIALGGVLFSTAAFASFGLASGALWQWYLLHAIYGLFALGFKSTIWSAGVSSAFTRSRSLALAVMLGGSALGQSLTPLAANWLIEGHGWRNAYFGLAGGWGGLAFVLVLLFFFDAREKSRRETSVPVDKESLPGMTVREALRDSRILRIALANVVLSTIGSGVSVHLVPIIASSGLDKTTAVEVAATAGLAGLAGKLISGIALDHVQGSVVPWFGYAIAALAYYLLLGNIEGTAALTAGAMILGFSSGAGLQISTYLVSRYAGLRNFGAIFGTISSMMMAGTAIGPLLAGRVFDVSGGYQPLLATAIPVALLTSLLFVGLGPYPEWQNPSKAVD